MMVTYGTLNIILFEKIESHHPPTGLSSFRIMMYLGHDGNLWHTEYHSV
jgi:hypothetical protein